MAREARAVGASIKRGARLRPPPPPLAAFPPPRREGTPGRASRGAWAGARGRGRSRRATSRSSFSSDISRRAVDFPPIRAGIRGVRGEAEGRRGPGGAGSPSSRHGGRPAAPEPERGRGNSSRGRSGLAREESPGAPAPPEAEGEGEAQEFAALAGGAGGGDEWEADAKE